MKVNKIIVHHSYSKDHATLRDFDEIKRWHTNKGWRDIGYHYVIEKVNGVYGVIKGRPENMAGAHTLGHNHDSIGICLVGNFMVDNVPSDMLDVLVDLIKDIRKRHGDIFAGGHGDFNATSCPGDKFPMAKLQEMLKGDSISKAIDKLVKLGIIGSPDYWVANAKAGQTVKGEYVKAIFERLAERGII